MDDEIVLPTARGEKRHIEMLEFADRLMEFQDMVGFKMSARGWGYFLEGEKVITKAGIDRAEKLVNECRAKGYLPIDFIASEEARKFSGVEKPEEISPIMYMKRFLSGALNCQEYYTPEWWEGEEYYIQMLVEKIDLKTLFKPVCEEYHIPIATSKGWASMSQRAEYARRFKEAEEKGLETILLYCGDLDPDGLLIGETIRKNLFDLIGLHWEDGTEGYDPTDLVVHRFGLNYDYVVQNNLTWIDNLITGSKGYLAKVVNGKIVQGRTKQGRPHPNFHLPYVQEYLQEIGVRKCEANAIVKTPDNARILCRATIEAYLGTDALGRFEVKRQEIRDILSDFRKRTKLQITIENYIKIIDEEDENDE